ncbi:MAG: hypothetical protein K0R39_2681 [Symbiobacteriaceae bacterium]|jgi:hypothetical protein|nr:hypothetical protein [Symbiobacteriaceae bacterium]
MRDKERGSVSPVFILILMVVMLLLGAFLDREWLNYKIHLADNIADFAAESGARTAEVWAEIRVTKYQYWFVPVTVCVDEKCTVTSIRMDFQSTTETKVVTDKDAEIRRNWPALAECGSNAEAPNWKCTSAEKVRQWVEYPASTKDLAEGVFRANWRDQSLARWTHLEATPRADRGLVDVEVTLEIRSVTGLVGWRHTLTRTGSAASRIEPLELTLP